MRPVVVNANTEGSWSQPVVLDYHLTPNNTLIEVNFNGNTGGTYTVQYTIDDPYAAYATDLNTNGLWWNHPTLVNLTASNIDNMNVPARAIRLLANTAGTGGTPIMTIVQAGGIS